MQSETAFKNRVLKDLKKLKLCAVLKTQERSRRGVPDLIICLKGRFLAIELKVNGEKPTPLQDFALKKVHAACGIAFWSDPDKWPGHYDILKAFQ